MTAGCRKYDSYMTAGKVYAAVAVPKRKKRLSCALTMDDTLFAVQKIFQFAPERVSAIKNPAMPFNRLRRMIHFTAASVA